MVHFIEFKLCCIFAAEFFVSFYASGCDALNKITLLQGEKQ